MRIEFQRDGDQLLADVDVGDGVEVLLVRADRDSEWEVWALRIHGRTYREPRDMEGEILDASPFLEQVKFRAGGS